MSSADGAFALEPVFIDAPAGRLFGVHYRPSPGIEPGRGLVFVPPFAEEMNRARRMASLLARALAARGRGVLVVDLSGTGDSDGAFEDADWPAWCADVTTAADWLRQREGRPVDLLGLRLGGLLAASVAGRCPGLDRLVLWSPTISGLTMLTQFLRIRLAASLGDAAEAAVGEDTKALRRRLAAGEAVEIAGYRLAPRLAAALEDVRLADVRIPEGIAVDWFEVVREAGRTVPPASERVIEAWTAAGTPVDVHTVTGEPFWSLQEITVAPGLVEATRAVLCGRAARP